MGDDVAGLSADHLPDTVAPGIKSKGFQPRLDSISDNGFVSSGAVDARKFQKGCRQAFAIDHLFRPRCEKTWRLAMNLHVSM